VKVRKEQWLTVMMKAFNQPTSSSNNPPRQQNSTTSSTNQPNKQNNNIKKSVQKIVSVPSLQNPYLQRPTKQHHQHLFIINIH
jgi:hypothetical protein